MYTYVCVHFYCCIFYIDVLLLLLLLLYLYCLYIYDIYLIYNIILIVIMKTQWILDPLCGYPESTGCYQAAQCP